MRSRRTAMTPLGTSGRTSLLEAQAPPWAAQSKAAEPQTPAANGPEQIDRDAWLPFGAASLE